VRLRFRIPLLLVPHFPTRRSGPWTPKSPSSPTPGRSAVLRTLAWRAAGLAAVALVVCGAASACEPPRLRGSGGQRIDGQRYTVTWRPLVVLRSGELLSLEVTVCANPGQPRPSTLRVDAASSAGAAPRHRPDVRPQGPARFVVERVQLEAPGAWDLRFEVNTGIEGEALTTRIELQ
jgi:hypothetical protein